MSSLLNPNRPLFFCPGCGHEKVVRAVDKAAVSLGIAGENLVIVSDIGCSGLFDTFFNTHAIHGLHGRALTYATGLKMARPELKVLVVMGDGGFGIGGAHVLASCRRNLDITLLVLNNFNYGMTGGQCSSTTPEGEHTSSGFLGSLEKPVDICWVAEASGTQHTARLMATDDTLSGAVAQAIEYQGFSLLDIWGLCPGRHLKRNPKTLSQLGEELKERARKNSGTPASEEKEEFGVLYRRAAAKTVAAAPPQDVHVTATPRIGRRFEMLILGAAGQFINTLGEVFSLAAMGSGLFTAQKNDYPITVLRGHSVAELVFDIQPIDFTGIAKPEVILCVAQEGVERRKGVFSSLSKDALVLTYPELEIPETGARVEIASHPIKVRKSQRGLALLATLARKGLVIEQKILENAIRLRYSGKLLDQSLELIRNLLV